MKKGGSNISNSLIFCIHVVGFNVRWKRKNKVVMNVGWNPFIVLLTDQHHTHDLEYCHQFKMPLKELLKKNILIATYAPLMPSLEYNMLH